MNYSEELRSRQILIIQNRNYKLCIEGINNIRSVQTGFFSHLNFLDYVFSFIFYLSCALSLENQSTGFHSFHQNIFNPLFFHVLYVYISQL